MSTAAPRPRQVLLSGRSLLELIRGVLEPHVGHVVEIINVQVILESLLEEYFFGGSFQDDFYEQLSAYRVPTDKINFIRHEVMRSIGEQVSGALGHIRPCNHYSFELLTNGDLKIIEIPPIPLHRKLRLVS